VKIEFSKEKKQMTVVYINFEVGYKRE